MGLIHRHAIYLVYNKSTSLYSLFSSSCETARAEERVWRGHTGGARTSGDQNEEEMCSPIKKRRGEIAGKIQLKHPFGRKEIRTHQRGGEERCHRDFILLFFFEHELDDCTFWNWKVLPPTCNIYPLLKAFRNYCILLLYSGVPSSFCLYCLL